MINPFLWLANTVIWLFIWVLIGRAILSWLIAFQVVNTRNQLVAMAADFFYPITEPVLRPIRNIIPNVGGIDISPLILIVGLMFLDRMIFWLYDILFT